MRGTNSVLSEVTVWIGPSLFGCLFYTIVASTDLLGSLVFLPSLRTGTTFCVLLLTANTGNSFLRFILDFPNEDELEFKQLGNPHKGSLATTNSSSNNSAAPTRVRPNYSASTSEPLSASGSFKGQQRKNAGPTLERARQR
jgi:hypothetical protein